MTPTSMFKQIILPLLALWEPRYSRRDYASLFIETPLKPLLAICNSGPRSVRDKYVCRQVHESRYYDDRERNISLDIMPDICGGPNTAPSDCLDTWEIMADRWKSTGWNLSEPFQTMLLGNGTGKDVKITGDWMQVRETLACLEGVQPAHINTNTLFIDVKRPRNCDAPFDYADVYIPTIEHVTQAANALLLNIRHLENLRKLSLWIPGQIDWFANALASNRTSKFGNSSSLTSLSLGPFSHPIIAHTPHIKRITLNQWLWYDGPNKPSAQNELVAAIKNSTIPLEHLELWDVMGAGALAHVAQELPALKSLELTESNVPFWGNFQLQTLIPSLSLFKNVTTLELPSPHALDPEFNPPWCGNVYFDNPGREEQVAREGRESASKLAKLVKEELVLVERVRFGGGRWYDL